jgi:CBS domain-containing protein
MTVKSILTEKGTDVFTIGPESTLSEAVRVMAENRIGAIVVTKGRGKIAGIISERDIVRTLAAGGRDMLDKPVSAAMTAKVRVCHENNTVHELMEIMTKGRFRHLPVERDGALAGLISIGDVVKKRIEEVEREAEEIRAYIATA